MSATHVFRLAILFSVAAAALHAQVAGGTISGRVTDATSALIPKARVLVRNDDTGQTRNLITNNDGSVTAPSEPVGNYTVDAEAPGFSRYRNSGVTLTIAQALELTVVLRVAGSKSVTVDGTPSNDHDGIR